MRFVRLELDLRHPFGGRVRLLIEQRKEPIGVAPVLARPRPKCFTGAGIDERAVELFHVGFADIAPEPE